MTKAEKRCGRTNHMWSLNQRISRLVFVNPNISVLKYGLDMEIEAVKKAFKCMKGKQKDIKLSDCEVFKAL